MPMNIAAGFGLGGNESCSDLIRVMRELAEQDHGSRRADELKG